MSALTQLESLKMGGALLTDAGMKALEPLRNLQSLDLSKMDITAQGIEPLTKLPKLKRLSLWRSTRIDDRAAPFLLQMKSLEVLDLSETYHRQITRPTAGNETAQSALHRRRESNAGAR